MIAGLAASRCRNRWRALISSVSIASRPTWCAPDVVRLKLATSLAQLDHVLPIGPLPAFHGSHPDEDDDDGARPR
jgi:hypothetical protein